MRIAALKEHGLTPSSMRLNPRRIVQHRLRPPGHANVSAYARSEKKMGALGT